MSDTNDFATLVIQHHVKPEATAHYELWVKKLHRRASASRAILVSMSSALMVLPALTLLFCGSTRMSI